MKQKLSLKIRIAIWLAACLASSILLFNEVWGKLMEWLSPEGLQIYGVFHWGVFALCILWLWLKRKDILAKMRTSRFSLRFILVGLALLALAILLPGSDDFLLFLMLLSYLGIFAIVFSGAILTPAILLGIYGFSVAFPMFMMDWLGKPAAVATTNMVASIARLLGLPVASEGIVLNFICRNGDIVFTTVAPACAGYATLGVFIALFALMMLDVRLPLKRAWYVFLIGLAGTWLQNSVRIVISIAAAYYWGAGALETMHLNISYVIFPLWYALFAYFYMQQAGWRLRPAKK